MLSAETKALSRSMKACHPASGGSGAADGFPRWRHPQRPRHSDEAGRADAQRAARRARGEGRYGFYMIGLSNMDADKDRNMQLLKERAWFDIPVVYSNNRRAILGHGKRLVRQARLRRCVRGMEAVTPCQGSHVPLGAQPAVNSYI
jgi:hypothetical protein